MKPTINIITFAVKDMDAALAFYCEGLGIDGEISRNEYHAAIDIGNDLSLALFTIDEFNKYARQTDTHTAFTKTIISHTAESREEVNDILRKAKAAGGTLPVSPTDYDGDIPAISKTWTDICGRLYILSRNFNRMEFQTA